MIELKAVQLRKQYTHRRLFSELSFEHRSGLLGIAGANGSGKSTLLRCLALLQGIDAGKIHWSRKDQKMTRQDFRSSIGFVAPNIQFYDELTVQENLEFVQKMSEFGRLSLSDNEVTPIDWLEDADKRFSRVPVSSFIYWATTKSQISHCIIP